MKKKTTNKCFLERGVLCIRIFVQLNSKRLFAPSKEMMKTFDDVVDLCVCKYNEYATTTGFALKLKNINCALEKAGNMGSSARAFFHVKEK